MYKYYVSTSFPLECESVGLTIYRSIDGENYEGFSWRNYKWESTSLWDRMMDTKFNPKFLNEIALYDVIDLFPDDYGGKQWKSELRRSLAIEIYSEIGLNEEK